MRSLTAFEISNINYLDNLGLKHAEIHFTLTIIKKAMFDANKSIKNLLKESGIHDFDNQEYGVEHKVFIDTHLLTFLCDIISETSLYRAGSRGDARMWFGADIFPLVQPDDMYSIFVFNQELYAVNITRLNIADCPECSLDNPIKTIVNSIKTTL